MSEDVGQCGWCKNLRLLVGMIPMPEPKNALVDGRSEIRLCGRCTREAIAKVYFVRRVDEGETESTNRFARLVNQRHRRVERERARRAALDA